MKIRKKPIIISVLSLVLCLSLVIGITHRMSLTAHAVEVTANMSGMTSKGGVSQTADNEYAFADGAQIQIVGWYGDWDKYNKPWEMESDTWWNSAVSTFNATNGKWNTEPYMRWQNGKGLEHHFVSYWPANLADPNSDLTNVPVTLTGSAEDDILLAHWSNERPEDNVLNLKFDHLLSRFDVHLYFRDEYEGATDISVETALSNKATVDLLSGTVSPEYGQGITMQEAPYPDGNWDWSGTCITVPHDFNGSLLTIKFTANGEEKSISYTHPSTLSFESGERVTLNLMVGKDKVELMDVTVGDWNQKNINAGEAEEDI